MNINNLFKLFIFIWIVFIPMKTSYYQISSVMIIFLFILTIIKNRNFYTFTQNNKKIIKKFFLIILTMVIANTINLITDLDSWEVVFNYIFRYFLIFYILLYLYEEKIITKKFIFISMMISLTLQAIDGCSQIIYNYDFLKGNYASLSTGLSGGTLNRNTFGFFMAIGASITSNMIFYKAKYSLTKSNIFILIFLLVLFMINLIFSYSRASWLFYTVFIFLIYSLNFRKLNRQNIYFLFFIFIFTTIIFTQFPTFQERMHQLISGYSSHRVEIWTNALHLIKNSPFIGYGVMTYKSVGLANFNGIQVSSIHNSILEILFYVGILGFLTYLNLLIYIFKKIISKKSITYIALFFAFLTITQFDQSIIKGITSLSTLVLFAFFIFVKESQTNE